jgi:Ca2+-binding EF-hand superfamily protein
VKKPPRSKLNANGVREIMVSDPEVDVTISEKELGQLFQEAGMPLHKQTISHLCTQLSSNKKGKGVSFEDLLLVLREPCGAQESAGDYEQVFRVYDRRNRGYFDYEDYKFVCEGISLDLTEGQIREAFEKIDVRRENKITLAGF